LNAAKAQELMIEFPSLIKRPVIEAGGDLLIGFDPDRYQELLGKGFRR
jgi:arsenate reductase